MNRAPWVLLPGHVNHDDLDQADNYALAPPCINCRTYDGSITLVDWWMFAC